MEQVRITIDTHVLIWSIDEAPKPRLSPTARETIVEAEENGIFAM